MKRLFDEKNDFLILDEIVYEKESFKAIVQDGVVSDDEIMKQSEVVISLLKRIEAELNDEQEEMVIDAISELAVLYQINSLRKGDK